DTAMLEAWKRISAEGFGGDTQIYYDAYARHGFGPDAAALHYVGYLGEQPVTSSTLLLAGGIAGIFDVSTPPARRRQGFGGAITLAAMQEARRRGYDYAWIWSSAMGKSVYGKLGFVAADFGVREYRWRKG
ncbi:MAG TPA: GNAT family N-acetyltransferase, partial [Rhizomicrobium sp.]|nr:GNAT family N-acetyltransferase [Rhizomicrobium sp.]